MIAVAQNRKTNQVKKDIPSVYCIEALVHETGLPETFPSKLLPLWEWSM
jgi:hypothetical protein